MIKEEKTVKYYREKEGAESLEEQKALLKKDAEESGYTVIPENECKTFGELKEEGVEIITLNK